MTNTVWLVSSVEGAEYSPDADTIPIFGLTDHVTPVFADPVTVAANCWDCEGVNVAEPGVTVMLTDAMPTEVVAVVVPDAFVAESE